MLAYEFYLDDGKGDSDLIGILPERRKDRMRITPQSILKWGMMVAGDGADVSHLFFVQEDM